MLGGEPVCLVFGAVNIYSVMSTKEYIVGMLLLCAKLCKCNFVSNFGSFHEQKTANRDQALQ